MKNALILSSLGLLATAAATELVRASGFQAPQVFSLGNTFLLLFLVLLAQVLVADYGAKPRPITLPRSRPLTRSVRRASLASAYHHIYAVRRGVEAARLAAPNRVVVFPRRVPSLSPHAR